MATQTDRGVPLSTLCPKYLHTNSTSHTWPFSAIAELIDNAYDPDVSANQFWIDKTVVQGQECLIFMDNGNGLDHKAMLKMLSFGYSEKVPVNGHRPIGMYGNGFKSGSMRLGKDTIVFSKSKNSLCVGMLSQTYLEMIGVDQIIIPIVCFEKGETSELTVKEEHKTSLQDILHYSPFKTREELLTEIEAITSTWSTEKTGTRIIIWNLRSTSTRTTEFDFDTDRYDIRIPSDVYETLNDPLQQTGVTSHIPACCYSLRVYCSILYLKPRMQINIRGQKVKSELIAKSLAHVKRDYYSPTFLKKRVPITFGYNTKSKEQYGVMMYHKNRLIKAYERLGCQLRANNKGVGVIGIIECDYLEPTHNKQSFIETDKYRKTMSSLATKLEEYWQQIRFEGKKDNPNSTPVEDGMKRPDQNWVQCDNLKCLKWRKLPDGIDCNKLPEKWFCNMNPDPQFRNCQVEEEPVDSDDDTRSSYRKTYKQHEKEAKNQEKKRQQEEEEQRRRSDQHNADLNRRKAAAKLTQNPTFSPSTPTTPRTRFNTESSERGAAVAESFTISQTACSTSSSSGLPVITDVCSLSTERGKRTHPSTTPQRTPKRLKMNSVSRAPSTPSTSVGPQNSPSVSNNNNDTDEADDDVHILESVSTPKPKKSEFSLAKVKTEREENTVSKESPLNFALDANVFETGSSTTSPPHPEMTSSITQTEMLKVKMETESQNLTDEEGRAGCSREAPTSDENIGNCIEEQVIKQESSGQTEREDEIQDNKDEARPPCADVHSRRDSSLSLPSMMEVQEQQDQLLELMQTTAQERDAFKEQVRIVTSHLQDTQSKLQKLSQINEKKVCYPRATQTEAEKDYKSLFEKLRQKIIEVMENKEALPSDAEMESSSAQDEEKDIDQIVLKVERLCQRLDQRNQEKDELHLQLNSLETERAHLALQCDNLKLSLQQQQQQQSENAERSTTPERSDGSSVEREMEVAGNTATEASRSLIELRHNVGRLLVNFVPVLELDQVNYECSVIDEILEQFLSERGSVQCD